MHVFLNQKRIKLDPRKVIGKGGEADIYAYGTDQALKIFKTPDHPDLAGFPHEKRAALDRLKLHQDKLPAFPKNLPTRVIAPETLATDSTGRQIRGYAMRLLRDAEVLNRYTNRTFRQAGVSHADVVAIFQDLHGTVRALHQAGVVIGDFNDLNVMVKGHEAYLIDADSFQFGNFLCQVFTTRFVDPRLCVWDNDRLMLNRPHQPESDWYAFTVMLMWCLLYVDPYGGLYRPAQKSKRVPNEARPMHRITVFHADVRYPRPAIPYGTLSDELLHHFHCVFEKDVRGEFPLDLLTNLRWQKCPTCGTEHARPTCPNCAQAAPTEVKSVTRVQGTVIASRLFHTRGQIQAVALIDNKLCWLSHEHQTFRREGGQAVFSGTSKPNMRFCLQPRATLLGYQGRLAVFDESGQVIEQQHAERFGNTTVIAANETHRYWISNGQLLRDGVFGPETIGNVLSGQTQFWVGPAFGFGFYRAGNLSVAFVFDAHTAGFNDSVQMPALNGQLVDSGCVFSTERAWFFASLRDRGQTVHHCVVIRRDGHVEATHLDVASEGGWLASRGHCALGQFLFAATDEGIVRMEVRGDRIVKTSEFPDTAPFVHAGCRLLAGSDGLYVVDHQTITHLRIRKN